MSDAIYFCFKRFTVTELLRGIDKGGKRVTLTCLSL